MQQQYFCSDIWRGFVKLVQEINLSKRDTSKIIAAKYRDRDRVVKQKRPSQDRLIACTRVTVYYLCVLHRIMCTLKRVNVKNRSKKKNRVSRHTLTSEAPRVTWRTHAFLPELISFLCSPTACYVINNNLKNTAWHD